MPPICRINLTDYQSVPFHTIQESTHSGPSDSGAIREFSRARGKD